MADSPKLSFIPKQAVGDTPWRVPHRQKHFNILNFIGLTVFLCGMILTAGVFLYKNINEKTLASKKQELQNIKSSFSQSDIVALHELDRRITVSRALLNAHLSPSLVFDALELRTQHDVTFTDFSYARRESGSVEVVLGGMALRFNTMALQNQQLVAAQVLASTMFSGFSIDDKGNVHFITTSEGNKVALAYTAPIVAAPAQNPNTATTTDELNSGVGQPVPDSGTGSTSAP